MNKMKDNDEVFKKTVGFSIIVLISISAISSSFFYVDNIFDYKAWITLVVGLGGALAGGIFTMFGVIKTIENEKNNRKLEKKEYLDNLRMRLNIEINHSLESIKEYYISALKTELDHLNLRLKLIDLGCEEKKKISILNDKDFNNLLLVSPSVTDIFLCDLNIKNDFYELINNKEFIDKIYRKNILNEFFQFYNFENKLYELGSEHKIKSSKFKFYITNKYISKKFTEVNAILETFISNPYEVNKIFGIEKLENEIKELEKLDIFENRYCNLIKFLDEEY